MKLDELDGVPPALLTTPAHQLYEYLDGPTLIRIRGAVEPPLLVTVLLHGNEHGGWDAVRAVLRRRGFTADGPGRLPRSLAIFVGNVEAARFRLRRLDHQPDYNRIWKGAEGPEATVARALVARVAEIGVWASVDAHNNTGVNPHYACVTRLDPTSLALARRFSRPVVHVVRPDTVQAAAMAELAPSIILEAGRPGEQRGVEHVADFLDALLDLDRLPEVPHAEIDLFHTVATVKVRDDAHFGFAEPRGERDERDLHLLLEFEHYNFQELDAGTLFGHVPPDRPLPLVVTDERDREVADTYFHRQGDEVRLSRPVVPAMFSPDPRIIRQDVVCYLMERVRTAV